MSNVKHINQDQFEELVLNASKPVVVDFWATWCGPCKAIAPILDELSMERKDIEIVKVDVDQNQDLARRYGIRSIPTMTIFNNGDVRATKVGAVNKSSLQAWLDMNVD